MLGTSDWIAIAAVLCALLCALYARRAANAANRSANASEKSASAADRSADTAAAALRFDKEKFEKERLAERHKKIDDLAKEAIDKWKTFGTAVHILSRATDLNEDEQKELLRRVLRGVGKPDSSFEDAWQGWLRHREQMDKKNK